MASPQRIQAIMFDFHDTLVELDQPATVIQAANTAVYAGLKAHQLAASDGEFAEIWRPFFQESLRETPVFGAHSPYATSIQAVATACGLTLTANDVATIVAAALAPWRSHTSLPDETRPALTGLQQHYRLAVLSNFNHPAYIAAMLEHFGLTSFFSAVVVSGAVGLRKPNPAMFELVLDRLGVTAAMSVMIGDNPTEDMRGAQAAGCHTVLLDRYNRHPDYPGQRIATLLESIPIIRTLDTP
ncbi:MAG: HAD family hydrolase [Herpetosiphonaceae bacterium]|nr:HAD family hydrolase [Herpetosiphonaceae bacterium]